jgi:hypothetical protein
LTDRAIALVTGVARQGFDALMAGVDHVVGGDKTVAEELERNRRTPEAAKAERMAELTRFR